MDAKQLIENLDANELRSQLSELDRQREAVVVLLRAATRRDKKTQPSKAAQGGAK